MTSQTSHPEAPVRHDYPLAIREAGFATAFGLLMKTFPYALVRFAILVGVSILTIVWTVVTLGGGALLGAKVHPWAGVAWYAGGVGAYGALWRLLLRYTLYLVKAGHIAVLTELITKGSIANGEQGMFSYGKAVVTDRFGEVNVLFGLDLLIRGVVRAFNRTLDWIAGLLPVPGLQTLAGIARAIIHAATTYIDETIFSYNLARGDDNPWRSGKDGLIYYAQNSKEILKTSIWIVILDKLLTVAVWLVMLAPAALVAWILPASAKAVGTGVLLFIAVLFAANVRSAFLKPVFLIMIMTKFHVLVHDQPMNEEWDAKLSKISRHFRKIKEKVSTPAPAATSAELPPLPAP